MPSPSSSSVPESAGISSESTASPLPSYRITSEKTVRQNDELHVLLPFPEPCVSFKARAPPPLETKPTQEYVVYVSIKQDILEAILTDNQLNAGDIFHVLSGHKVPDADEKEYEFWKFMKTDAGAAYTEFSKSFSCGDFTVTEVPNIGGGVIEWKRVELGRNMRLIGLPYVPSAGENDDEYVGQMEEDADSSDEQSSPAPRRYSITTRRYKDHKTPAGDADDVDESEKSDESEEL